MTLRQAQGHGPSTFARDGERKSNREVPRRCIAFVPCGTPGLAGWTRCPAAPESDAAAQPDSGQQGDVFCRNHREAACGIVLGLLNDQKLADDATASREMARMAGSYFASQYWSRLCGKRFDSRSPSRAKVEGKTPAAAGPNRASKW